MKPDTRMNSMLSVPCASETSSVGDDDPDFVVRERTSFMGKTSNGRSFCWQTNDTSNEGHTFTTNSVDAFPFMDTTSQKNCLDSAANKHFSYYSTDAEKLMKHLDLNGIHQQTYPCAFHSWSPIYGPLKVIPSTDVSVRSPFVSVPFTSEELNKNTDNYFQSQSSPVSEKLSYSDALTKSPVIKPRECHSPTTKQPKSDRSRKVKCTSSSVCKEHAIEPESNVLHPTKLPRDSRDFKSPSKMNDIKLNHADSVQTKINGNELDEIDLLPTCKKPVHIPNNTTETGEEKPEAKDSDYQASFKKEQAPKNTLNNLQNTQKVSQKRPLNYNNNLSSSWQEPKYTGQFKPKVKNVKDVSGNENPLSKKNVIENEQKRTSSSNKKPQFSERNPKSINKRRKQQKTDVSGMDWSSLSSYLHYCMSFLLSCIYWLIELILDVFHMSAKLGWQLFQVGWSQFLLRTADVQVKIRNIPGVIFSYLKNKFWPEKRSSGSPNISFPVTRDAAMKRLLSCKGKDPYSIIGVSPMATDEEIKKYYRRQAFLVHPDKNPTPGAEEAFKILVQAFELIGEPEKRQKYDSKMMEAQQFETAWNDFSDLVNKLQEKMEAATNSIKCTSCGRRHHRLKIDRPCYSARYCSSCKTFHAARDGDIWAESKIFGFMRRYYACMESSIFDVTEWAVCQSVNLKHLKANHHNIQYRIISNKKSPTTDEFSGDTNFDDLFNAFQGKKSAWDVNSPAASKQDTGKKRKSKKKR